MHLETIETLLNAESRLELPLWHRREAAVLIPVAEREGELHLLFTRRRDDLSSHQGEISFPGGGREPGDQSSWQTAVREACEEVDLPADRVRHLGTLDDSVTITGFRVTPHVGLVPAGFEPRPNPDEVAEIMWVPLKSLAAQDRSYDIQITIRGLREDFPLYRHQGHLIWGATARIVQTLLRGLKTDEQRTEAERLGHSFRAVARRLLAGRRYLLATHVNPDADGLGCQVALARLLRGLGREVIFANSDPVPKRFAFIHDPDEKTVADAATLKLHEWADTLVIVDTGEYRRLGRTAELARRMAGRIVLLDHHLSGDILGDDDVGVADPAFSSCGEMVHRLLLSLSAPLTRELADPLYAALQFDTRGFRFIQNRYQPLQAAAALVEAGADAVGIQERLFATLSRGELAASARLLADIRYEHEDRFAWVLVPRGLEKETGADREEIGEVISTLIALDGVRAAALVREENGDRIKLSLRSKRDWPVVEVAAAFGGGGHANACGAVVRGNVDDVIKDLIERMKSVVED